MSRVAAIVHVHYKLNYLKIKQVRVYIILSSYQVKATKSMTTFVGSAHVQKSPALKVEHHLMNRKMNICED